MKLAMPRVLPVTIGVMFTLLAIKSTMLVRAAVPHAESAPSAVTAPVNAIPAPAATGTTPAAAASGNVVPEPAPVNEAERALLGDLRRRRIELDGRAQALDLRDQVQAAAEQRLSARLDQLTSLQQRLEQIEVARKAHDEANWHAMVKVYETMKPRDAAAIFNDLDRPVLLQIVDRMQERRASMVLAAMQPERARELTAALAAMRVKAEAIPAVPQTGPGQPASSGKQ